VSVTFGIGAKASEDAGTFKHDRDVPRETRNLPVSLDLPALLNRVYYRYPSFLLDAIIEHEPGVRLVAVKNVTISEEFFQGHFPGSPVMPGVLMIEALTQVAAVLILERATVPETARASLRGVNGAKFRKQVVPGDRLRLEVTLGRARSRLATAKAVAYVDDQVVTEAELLVAIETGAAAVDQSAHVNPCL
jgi:beta-hydroxyacyl-ACP dehydratase FabZ